MAEGLQAGETAAPPRQFRFTERDFRCIQRLVRELAGIELGAAKRELVYSRLSRRLRALGLDSFRAYCERLRSVPQETAELLNAITTNLTAFFREPHHFEHLAREALPAVLERRRDTRRVRIWSAGCSTGQEPYSIAMTVLERLPAGWDLRILATDIDENALARARAGIYEADAVRALPRARLARWFLRGRGANEGRVRVRRELREAVCVRRLNLVGDWPLRGPLDVVFCRNTLIYFGKDTQRRIVERFADLLGAGGWLYLGHSESLFKVTDRFELVGQTIYRCRG
ncbi:MAG TPA: protein-glutamate O-methyltransferase CheR [Chromatiales bacterium]|nr:protein-glutamate O-methyltransferase CheR [Chromatiales bacterium]